MLYHTAASIKLFILTKDFSDFSESSRGFFYKTQVDLMCIFFDTRVFFKQAGSITWQKILHFDI